MMESKILYTPVLLLCFNRPEQTQQVFETIRSVKPQKLYVAVDAPREGRADDVENSKKVKEIVTNVDWECETHYLFQEKNLGCSKSGVTAWDWIFETEDRMIFIEDDGVGTKSAFFFVQDMLERYKDDNRIAYVGAVNHKLQYGDKSYFFSRYPDSTYFMGTWKRTHKLYEYELESYNQIKDSKSFNDSFWGWQERVILNQRFSSYIESIKQGRRHNTYDVQMLYLCYKHNMYNIYPNVNMISNIGTESGANSFNKANSDYVKEYGNRERFEMETIKYYDSSEVFIDATFEKKHFKKRMLHNKNIYMVWLKSFLLEHFGTFYSRYIKPLRWDR